MAGRTLRAEIDLADIVAYKERSTDPVALPLIATALLASDASLSPWMRSDSSS
jgi:hypothetical protein